MTPDEHLSVAVATLETANRLLTAGDAEGVHALGTLALAHATVAGELMAQRADDARPAEQHECALPTDLPPGTKDADLPTIVCVDCGSEWVLYNVGVQHLTWVQQRVVRRESMPTVGA